MNILLADENVDYRLVQSLRMDFPQVESVFESHRGISDIEVIELANKLDAIILTEDKDFGELTYRLKIENRGIILIRLSDLKIEDKISTVKNAINGYGDKMYRRFTVISLDKIRIRDPQL